MGYPISTYTADRCCFLPMCGSKVMRCLSCFLELNFNVEPTIILTKFSERGCMSFPRPLTSRMDPVRRVHGQKTGSFTWVSSHGQPPPCTMTSGLWPCRQGPAEKLGTEGHQRGPRFGLGSRWVSASYRQPEKAAPT